MSRNVTAHASANTGISADVIKKLLPVAATMAMGALSQKTSPGSQLRSAADAKEQSLLGSLLGSDNDGSSLVDMLDFAREFF